MILTFLSMAYLITRDFDENSLHTASELRVRMWWNVTVTTAWVAGKVLGVRKGSLTEQAGGKFAGKSFWKNGICTYKFTKHKKACGTENRIKVGIITDLFVLPRCDIRSQVRLCHVPGCAISWSWHVALPTASGWSTDNHEQFTAFREVICQWDLFVGSRTCFWSQYFHLLQWGISGGRVLIDMFDSWISKPLSIYYPSRKFDCDVHICACETVCMWVRKDPHWTIYGVVSTWGNVRPANGFQDFWKIW